VADPVEVVWFERRGMVLLGAVTGRGEKKAQLLDEQGVAQRLPWRKVLHRGEARLPDGPADDLSGRLRDLRRALCPEEPGLDPEDLWERLDEGRHYALADLAEVALGGRDDAAVSRLVAAITGEDHRVAPCLQLRREGFRRTGAEAWARIKERREAERRLRAEEDAFLAWYGPRRDDGRPLPEPPAAVAPHLEQLRSWALMGERSPHTGPARHLARRLGVKDPDPLLAELERAGALPPHVNALPHRAGLPTRFVEPAEDRARVLRAEDPARPPGIGPLEDLTRLPTVAIDEPFTREVDDALSAWEEDRRTFLAVHIALAAGRLPPGDPLELEARRRGTSVYFPDEVFPMLPWPVVEEVFSLEAGVDRPALSLVCALGPGGAPVEPRFVASRIRVDARFSYDDEPPTAAAAEVVRRLVPAARAVREERREAGALLFSLPQVKLRLDAEGRPYPHTFPSGGPAHLVVSELMILFNRELARALARSGAPALYRTQPEPLDVPEEDPADPLWAHDARRGLPPTQVAVAPGPHLTLGVDAYCQGTSPIRRYGDLLAQAQLLALLRGEDPPHGRVEVESIKDELEPLERRARRLEARRDRYWCAVWLEGRTEPLEGRISRTTGRRPMAWIDALGRALPVRYPDDEDGRPPPPPERGTLVRLRPRRLVPREGLIELEPAD